MRVLLALVGNILALFATTIVPGIIAFTGTCSPSSSRGRSWASSTPS